MRTPATLFFWPFFLGDFPERGGTLKRNHPKNGEKEGLVYNKCPNPGKKIFSYTPSIFTMYAPQYKQDPAQTIFKIE